MSSRVRALRGSIVAPRASIPAFGFVLFSLGVGTALLVNHWLTEWIRRRAASNNA